MDVYTTQGTSCDWQAVLKSLDRVLVAQAESCAYQSCSAPWCSFSKLPDLWLHIVFLDESHAQDYDYAMNILWPRSRNTNSRMPFLRDSELDESCLTT